MLTMHFFVNLIFFELFTKNLKIEGTFHGGLRNSCFFIWEDWSWETASWILKNIYKIESRSYLYKNVAYFKNINLMIIKSLLIICRGGGTFFQWCAIFWSQVCSSVYNTPFLKWEWTDLKNYFLNHLKKSLNYGIHKIPFLTITQKIKFCQKKWLTTLFFSFKFRMF